MDSRLHKASDKDLYKRVLDTLGIIVLVVGLYFAWDQAKQFNRSQNLANWSDVTSRTFDVDKIFIDNPEFQKYFFAGVDTKKDDAELRRHLPSR